MTKLKTFRDLKIGERIGVDGARYLSAYYSAAGATQGTCVIKIVSGSTAGPDSNRATIILITPATGQVDNVTVEIGEVETAVRAFAKVHNLSVHGLAS